MKNKFLISRRVIRKNSFDLYTIAEIGTNFVEFTEKDSNLQAINRMIHYAKESGFDAVKFQVYREDTLSSKEHPGYEYFKKHSTGNELWNKVRYLCSKKEIGFILTIFGEDILEEIGDLPDALKVASTDINNKRLIKTVALCGKPVILSTGASTMEEVKRAVEWCYEENMYNVAVLHCVCNYPVEEENFNLGAIKDLNYSLDTVVGYSDHSMGGTAMSSAHLIGANIIEKHFTFDTSIKGNDHEHSITPNRMQSFMKDVNLYTKSVYGIGKKVPLDSESSEILYGRRYLVYNKNIEENKIIDNDDIKLIKLSGREIYSNSGLISADQIDSVMGKHAMKNFNKGEVACRRDYEGYE